MIKAHEVSSQIDEVTGLPTTVEVKVSCSSTKESAMLIKYFKYKDWTVKYLDMLIDEDQLVFEANLDYKEYLFLEKVVELISKKTISLELTRDLDGKEGTAFVKPSDLD